MLVIHSIYLYHNNNKSCNTLIDILQRLEDTQQIRFEFIENSKIINKPKNIEYPTIYIYNNWYIGLDKTIKYLEYLLGMKLVAKTTSFS